jgi:hypothetical protein
MWITPITNGMNSFVTALVANIPSAFQGLFLNATLDGPSSIAELVLSFIGMFFGFKVVNYTVNLFKNFITICRAKKA